MSTAVVLLVASAAVAVGLPPAFRLSLAAYVVLNLSYSLDLKRGPLLDVIVLATLYATWIVAGEALVDVPLTRWFLALSLFLFFSLALVKRVADLQAVPEGSGGSVSGRSYLRADVSALVALGAACTAASALVYCLYVTGDEAERLYRHPDVLWVGLPLLLYW